MNNNLQINIDLIIEEYSNYLWKVINNLNSTHLSIEDKEEILSDTFYLFWKNSDKVETNIKSYLSKIAKNLCYRKLKQKEIELEYSDDKLVITDNDYLKTIILNDSISKLSEEEKLILNMHYTYGYKVKEIAKILKITSTNVKVRLYRIRKTLKGGLYGKI